MTGTAAAEKAVWPVYTAPSWDSHSGAPQWSTQCVMDGGSGSWSADVTFAAAGNVWALSFSAGGNPTPGRHATQVGPQPDTAPDVIEVDLRSQKPIADYITSAVTGQYAYYVPVERGDPVVAVDAGDRSGTVDAWFTPDQPSNLVFHLVGAWACD